MMQLIKGSLILLLVLLAIPHKSLALDSPAKAGAGQRLKTIIVDNYHPYTFLNDKGQPDGFSVEIARAVAKAMDLELEIRVDTWDAGNERLRSGQEHSFTPPRHEAAVHVRLYGRCHRPSWCA